MNILLDMDGVLADFFSAALKRLNTYRPNKAVTAREWAEQKLDFMMEKHYEISPECFWEIIENPYPESIWLAIDPFPWAKELVEWVSQYGEVTIATFPSANPVCPQHKTQWMKERLGLENKSMMIGARKYLMAKPGNILIDDYRKNIDKFRAAGGDAIQVPSNWTTYPLTFEMVKSKIQAGMEELLYRNS